MSLSSGRPAPLSPDPDDSEDSWVFAGRRKRGSEEERYFPFTPELEEELVDWWKENGCLYNNTVSDFHNKVKKRRLFEQKAAEIGRGCTALDVERRLKSLRTTYSRLLKEVGGDADPTKLGNRAQWLWTRLDFVRPYVIARASKSRANKPLYDENSEQGEKVASGIVGPSTQPPGKDARSVPQYRPHSQVTGGWEEPLSHEARNLAEQELDSFLALLRCKLLRLPAQLRLDHQDQVLQWTSQIVREYERGEPQSVTLQQPFFQHSFMQESPYQQPSSPDLLPTSTNSITDTCDLGMLDTIKSEKI